MRNFKIEDFEKPGKYLLRMSSEEIYAQENNESFSGYPDSDDLSKRIVKVGWIPGDYNVGNGELIYALINMSDGKIITSNYVIQHPELSEYHHIKQKWIGNNGKAQQYLCKWLNDTSLSKEYRFATQKEIIKMIIQQNLN
jgi:hypothetical protein